MLGIPDVWVPHLTLAWAAFYHCCLFIANFLKYHNIHTVNCTCPSVLLVDVDIMFILMEPPLRWDISICITWEGSLMPF